MFTPKTKLFRDRGIYLAITIQGNIRVDAFCLCPDHERIIRTEVTRRLLNMFFNTGTLYPKGDFTHTDIVRRYDGTTGEAIRAIWILVDRLRV